MQQLPSNDTLVMYRPPYARRAEQVRLSELPEEAQARYSGAKPQVSARASALSALNTATSRSLSLPWFAGDELTIALAVTKRS